MSVLLRVPFRTASPLVSRAHSLGQLPVRSTSSLHPSRRSYPSPSPTRAALPTPLLPQSRLSSTMASDPIVEALSEFTACDISDALLKLKVANGGFLAGITLWSPQRQEGTTKIVGPAYTVKYAPLSDPSPKHPTHYIDTIPEGAVVFISSPRTPNAVFGGLMSTRAQYSKAAGTVIDGRLRDLQEHRDLGFPVFARDVSTTAPQEVAKVVGVDVPVRFQTEDQDVTIQPGDYVVADLNGVVVLPRALAEAALPLIRKQLSADEQMAVAIKAGMSFTEASKKYRG